MAPSVQSGRVFLIGVVEDLVEEGVKTGLQVEACFRVIGEKAGAYVAIEGAVNEQCIGESVRFPVVVTLLLYYTVSDGGDRGSGRSHQNLDGTAEVDDERAGDGVDSLISGRVLMHALAVSCCRCLPAAPRVNLRACRLITISMKSPTRRGFSLFRSIALYAPSPSRDGRQVLGNAAAAARKDARSS